MGKHMRPRKRVHITAVGKTMHSLWVNGFSQRDLKALSFVLKTGLEHIASAHSYTSLTELGFRNFPDQQVHIQELIKSLDAATTKL